MAAGGITGASATYESVYPLEAIDTKGISRLIVRFPNWIGDAVMATPALGTVRRCFPDSEIVVLANEGIATLLEHHPFCDRTMVLDKRKIHRGPAGIFRVGREIRKERFDLAILFQNAVEAALIAWLGGIPRRAGYTTDGRAFLLTHRVRIDDRVRRLHHTDYYQHMLEGLGFRKVPAAPLLRCTAQEIQWVRNLLGEAAWVAVNPGAAYGSAKRWFPERFALTADALHERRGLKPVIIGSPADEPAAAAIEASMKTKPLNLAGKTSIREMMAVISHCRLMVTNDSGPMHVAAAFRVPIVAVFGPTDPGTTSPAGVPARLLRKPTRCAPCLLRDCPIDHRCMDRITAPEAIAAAEELLEETA